MRISLQAITCFFLVYLALFENVHAGQAIISTPSATISIPVQSWKTIRDAQVVKQDLDYSCGAASLATILNEFYGQSVTEEGLLKVMDKGDMRASFEDMQKALPQFGFRAIGYAASYEQLLKIKIPVVVYLKHRKDDHFSVLRGIDKQTVWLADPSLGNRTYSREQFLEMWETRKDDSPDAMLKGKLLAILPDSKQPATVNTFFTRSPVRQTARAVATLNARAGETFGR